MIGLQGYTPRPRQQRTCADEEISSPNGLNPDLVGETIRNSVRTVLSQACKGGCVWVGVWRAVYGWGGCVGVWRGGVGERGELSGVDTRQKSKLVRDL